MVDFIEKAFQVQVNYVLVAFIDVGPSLEQRLMVGR